MKAIYPGTFDPMTYGHVDVAKRAAGLFDKMVLAVSDSRKKDTMFSQAERVEMAHECLKDCENIEVVPFKCLLVNFMQKIDANVVIRGLRAVSDFEFEFQMALTNRKIYPDCETIFLMPNKKYIFLSSSMVREIAYHNGDISQFVPENVLNKFHEKFGHNEADPC